MIGPLFEHFIICGLHRLNEYYKKDFSFSYLATKGGMEIDIVGTRPGMKSVFIEIKSSENVKLEQLKHLIAVSRDYSDYEAMCFCRESRARKIENISIVPWQEGFERIGL